MAREVTHARVFLSTALLRKGKKTLFMQDAATLALRCQLRGALRLGFPFLGCCAISMNPACGVRDRARVCAPDAKGEAEECLPRTRKIWLLVAQRSSHPCGSGSLT